MGKSPSQFYLVLVGVEKRLESSEGSLIYLAPELGRLIQLGVVELDFKVSLTLSSFSM